MNRAGYYLGRTMSILAVVLNPKRFIIGGGVSKAGEIPLRADPRSIREAYTAELRRKAWTSFLPILGNNAGVVGAAGLHHKGVNPRAGPDLI